MCGICGFTQADDASLPTLKAMCDVMAHRGPDGEGQYIDAESGIALGHRRLSLIDLANGNQPMVRSTGDHAAVITSPALHLDGTPCAVSYTHLDVYKRQELKFCGMTTAA